MSSSLSSNGNQLATFCFAYRYDFVCRSIRSPKIAANLPWRLGEMPTDLS